MLRACRSTASDVGMPVTCNPRATRSPSSDTAREAVVPLPSPTTMPSSTSATAASAAARFHCSNSGEAAICLHDTSV